MREETQMQHFEMMEPLNRNKHDNVEIIDDMKNFKYERPLEYWLILIGYAIGYGSFWRFPYLIYSCGGGVFFIPFFIFFILIAIPLFTLENALGQIFKKGPVEVFDMMHKKFRGVGWAAVLVCWFISIYYAIILCWSVYYMILSFISPLPWSMGAQSQMNNVTNTNTTSVEEDFINFDFFTKEVLRMSDGIHNMGSLNYELAGCLVITYFLIFICIYEGIKSSSKAVYFTCPAPVILMIILLLNVLTLPGYEIGIKYLLIPDMSRLFDFDVWVKASNQVIFMLSLGIGGNILFSTYRKENEDVYLSSLWIPIITVIFGFLCAIINFSYLGHFSYLANIPIDQLPLSGTDLAFVTYPSALCMLPFPNLWSILFFFMLITLGIDSQFGFNEQVTHYLYETYLYKYCTRTTCCILVCVTGFCVGLPFLTEGGFYLFELVDNYASLLSCFSISLLESYVVSKYIGIEVLREIIANKTGKVLPDYLIYSLKYLSPITLSILLLFSLQGAINLKQEYNATWPYFLQWFIILTPLLIIFWNFIKYKDSDTADIKEFKNTKNPSQSF